MTDNDQTNKPKINKQLTFWLYLAQKLIAIVRNIVLKSRKPRFLCKCRVN